MLEGLTEGRIVRYVLPDGYSKGEARPAIVVKVWDRQSGCCNLQVFTDGINDGEAYKSGLVWETSRVYSETPKPGTWHWPERV